MHRGRGFPEEASAEAVRWERTREMHGASAAAQGEGRTRRLGRVAPGRLVTGVPLCASVLLLQLSCVFHVFPLNLGKALTCAIDVTLFNEMLWKTVECGYEKRGLAVAMKTKLTVRNTCCR